MRKKKELSIAQEITQVREGIPLSIAEFARVLGIRPNRLTKWEAHGKEYCVIPQADWYRKIMSYKRGE